MKNGVQDSDEEVITKLSSFNSKYTVLTLTSNVDELYDNFSASIIKKSDEFQERDSGPY